MLVAVPEVSVVWEIVWMMRVQLRGARVSEVIVLVLAIVV
jgi:hypothetical protein